MFLPADLIFTRNEKSWIGPAIRWFTRARGEAPSWTNHTAGIGLTGSTVIEANWSVQELGWDEWNRDNERFQVWRCNRLPDSARLYVAGKARSYVGRSYGWWKLGAHLVDGVLAKVAGRNVYALRRCLFLDNYPVCSWVWAFAYDVMGIRFGCNPDCADPDTQHDFVSSSPDWKMVFAKR